MSVSSLLFFFKVIQAFTAVCLAIQRTQFQYLAIYELKLMSCKQKGCLLLYVGVQKV